MSRHKRLRRLNEFPSYKGGDTIVVAGYVLEYSPHHRLANFWGYVQQHRLVAEDKLGRHLQRNEAVHHIDRCRSNNHPDNLEVMDRTEHIRMHSRDGVERTRLQLTRERVSQALEGRNLKQAARLLRCDSQSLRNLFPDLVKPRQRQSPICFDNPRDLDRVIAAATDPRIGLNAIAKELRMSPSTVLRICERQGVPWVRKKRSESPRGPRRKNRVPRNYWPDDDVVARILAAAADPTTNQAELLEELQLSYSVLARVLKRHRMRWRKNLERPTLRASAIYASHPEPAQQPPGR